MWEGARGECWPRGLTIAFHTLVKGFSASENTREGPDAQWSLPKIQGAVHEKGNIWILLVLGV